MRHFCPTLCPTDLGSTSKTGAKNFGASIPTGFSCLSAEYANTQAVVFKIPETVRSSLDQLHFSMEAFGYPVVFREAEHPGYLLLTLHLQNAWGQRLHLRYCHIRQTDWNPFHRALLLWSEWLPCRHITPVVCLSFYTLPPSLRENPNSSSLHSLAADLTTVHLSAKSRKQR